MCQTYTMCSGKAGVKAMIQYVRRSGVGWGGVGLEWGLESKVGLKKSVKLKKTTSMRHGGVREIEGCRERRYLV